MKRTFNEFVNENANVDTKLSNIARYFGEEISASFSTDGFGGTFSGVLTKEHAFLKISNGQDEMRIAFSKIKVVTSDGTIVLENQDSIDIYQIR